MKKPVVGILMRCDEDENKRSFQYVFDGVRNSIIRSGAIPFLLCPVNDFSYYQVSFNDFKDFSDEELDLMEKSLDICDALFLPGGYKFTKYDLTYLDMAIKRNMPVFGVCLGMQIMASYKIGYNLTKIDSVINHRQEYNKLYCHDVSIDKSSILYKILLKDKIKVNSFHKMQALFNPLYNVVSYSPDGVIEAIEMIDKNFVVGCQWHPEKMINYDMDAKKMMDYFIHEALIYKNSKKAKLVKI